MKRLLIILTMCFALVGCGALNQDISLIEDVVEQEKALVVESSAGDQEIAIEKKDIETNLFLDDDTNVWMNGAVEDVQLTFSGGKNLCDGGENLTYENPSSNELGDLLLVTVVCGEEKEIYVRDITSAESHNLGIGEKGTFVEGGIQIGEIVVDNPFEGRVIERKDVGGRMIFVKDYDVSKTEELRKNCLLFDFKEVGLIGDGKQVHCSNIYSKGNVSFPKIKGIMEADANNVWQLSSFLRDKEFFLGIGSCLEGDLCLDYEGMSSGPEIQLNSSQAGSTKKFCDSLDQRGELIEGWCLMSWGEVYGNFAIKSRVLGMYLVNIRGGRGYIRFY